MSSSAAGRFGCSLSGLDLGLVDYSVAEEKAVEARLVWFRRGSAVFVLGIFMFIRYCFFYKPRRCTAFLALWPGQYKARRLSRLPSIEARSNPPPQPVLKTSK